MMPPGLPFLLYSGVGRRRRTFCGPAVCFVLLPCCSAVRLREGMSDVCLHGYRIGFMPQLQLPAVEGHLSIPLVGCALVFFWRPCSAAEVCGRCGRNFLAQLLLRHSRVTTTVAEWTVGKRRCGVAFAVRFLCGVCACALISGARGAPCSSRRQRCSNACAASVSVRHVVRAHQGWTARDPAAEKKTGCSIV